MVNGPPCAVCGSGLRWVAEQHGWWCERCQTLVAASGPNTVASGPRAHSPSQPGYPVSDSSQPLSPRSDSSQPLSPRSDSSQPLSPYAPGGGGAPYAPRSANDGVPNPYAGPREASQPYSPIPLNRPQPAPPPPKRSNKGLVIGLCIGAVAIIGIVIAVVVAGGGGSASERDRLVAKAFAALADEKQLIALIDAEQTVDKVLDCSPTAKATDSDDDFDYDPDKDSDEPRGKRDRRRHLERTEKEISKAVEMAKGAKIEVVEVMSKLPKPFPKDDDGDDKGDKDKRDKDDNKDDDAKDDDKQASDKKTDAKDDEEDATIIRYAEGKRVFGACVAKSNLTIQLTKVKIKVTPEGKDSKSYEDRVTLVLLHVEGDKWYLVAAPRVYTGSSEIVAKARTFRDRMCDCKDVDCYEAVDEDFEEWRDDAKTDDLPPDEEEGYDSVRDDYRACERALREANKGAAGERAIKQMTALRDQMCACKDSACGDRVKRDAKFPDTFDLDDDSRRQVTQLREKYTDCSINLIIGSTRRPPDIDMRIEPDIAPACEDYARAMQKLAACDKYPEGAKDALKESFKTMMGLWKGYSMMKPEVQQATVDTCISGRRSTQDSITKYGCN